MTQVLSVEYPFLAKESYFINEHGNKLAYIYDEPKDIAKGTIVFLHGYLSEMYGDKANALAEFAKESGMGFFAIEYSGHGRSAGDFIKDGCIGLWQEDILSGISKVVGKENLTLVGSSMGGWLAFLVAKALANRVDKLIGLAAALDFTELLKKELSAEEEKQWQEQGVIYEEATWDKEVKIPWTKKLFDEGKNNLVIGTDFPDIPIVLMHGIADDVVPWQHALHIVDWLKDKDFEIWFSNHSDHRLSSQKDLQQLVNFVRKKK